MAVVIAALLPVFLLIVLGFILKRSLMRLDAQWHGLERLTYYVLFPMLLIQTLVKADLTKVPVGGVGGALFLSALAMSLLCLALRPALERLDIDGRRIAFVKSYTAEGLSRPTTLAVQTPRCCMTRQTAS
jgi:malonate transporter